MRSTASAACFATAGWPPELPAAYRAADQAQRIRLGGLTGARAQEVEVAAGVGLHHVLDVQPAVAARIAGGGVGEGVTSPPDLGGIELELDRPRVDVEWDRIPVRHDPERPARERLRRPVQHTRAEGRAAHPRVRDPPHVGDPGTEQLVRYRQLPP